MDPATIRYRNPGGQYPGASASRFGSTGHEIIGGGHKIATFPDAESGAAAQFDLLARNYAGMPLRDAIRKWSGGNSADQYAANIARATGVSPDTVLTPELLADPRFAVPLAKAMAQHETGRAYPLTDEQWAAAHSRATGNTNSPAGGPVYPASTDGQARPETTPSADIGAFAAMGTTYGQPEPRPSQPQQSTGNLLALDDEPQALMQPVFQRPLDMQRLRQALVSRLGTARA